MGPAMWPQLTFPGVDMDLSYTDKFFHGEIKLSTLGKETIFSSMLDVL